MDIYHDIIITPTQMQLRLDEKKQHRRRKLQSVRFVGAFGLGDSISEETIENTENTGYQLSPARQTDRQENYDDMSPHHYIKIWEVLSVCYITIERSD